MNLVLHFQLFHIKVDVFILEKTFKSCHLSSDIIFHNLNHLVNDLILISLH